MGDGEIYSDARLEKYQQKRGYYLKIYYVVRRDIMKMLGRNISPFNLIGRNSNFTFKFINFFILSDIKLY